MKTRNSNRQIETIQQESGCCGAAPVQEQVTKSSCCGSVLELEEAPQTSGGCC